jgi:hypothetical protein
MKRMAARLAMLSPLLILLLGSPAVALQTEDVADEDAAAGSLYPRMDATPRSFFYFNSSSTATALTLLGSLILLGVIFYLVYVGGLLAPTPSSKAGEQGYGGNYAYNKNDYYYPSADQQQFRAR